MFLSFFHSLSISYTPYWFTFVLCLSIIFFYYLFLVHLFQLDHFFLFLDFFKDHFLAVFYFQSQFLIILLIIFFLSFNLSLTALATSSMFICASISLFHSSHFVLGPLLLFANPFNGVLHRWRSQQCIENIIQVIFRMEQVCYNLEYFSIWAARASPFRKIEMHILGIYGTL